MGDNVLGNRSLVHVAIIVGDIEAKARAWAELLRIPMPDIIVTDPVEISHTEYHGVPSTARARITSLQTGDVRVELIEPLGGPSTWLDHLQKHGDSLHHIAFRVEGLEAVITGLQAIGIPVVQAGDFTGGRYVYVDAVEQLGTMLELIEICGDRDDL
jgi:methylmalonyl-CoA/ethylmalonyl-CoA epimerase